VVVELLSTRTLGCTSRADLDAWVRTYRLPITTVIDALEGRPTPCVSASNRTYGVRESAFIVDLATMRIVRKYNGDLGGAGDSAIGMLVPELLRLLGSGM
jgi:hypothetical protein